MICPLCCVLPANPANILCVRCYGSVRRAKLVTAHKREIARRAEYIKTLKAAVMKVPQ